MRSKRTPRAIILSIQKTDSSFCPPSAMCIIIGTEGSTASTASTPAFRRAAR